MQQSKQPFRQRPIQHSKVTCYANSEPQPAEHPQRPLLIYVKQTKRRKGRFTEYNPPTKPQKKQAEETKNRRLPSKAEILQLAKELFLETQQRMGLDAINPEEDELRETGFILKAQQELMTGVSSVANSQVAEYIQAIKAELLPLGFTVIELPLEYCDPDSLFNE